MSPSTDSRLPPAVSVPDRTDPAALAARPSRRAARSEAESAAARQDRWIRALNLVVSGLLLVLTAPLWLVVAVLIKAGSRGPVIYSQTRVGLDRRRPREVRDDSQRGRDLGGRPFTIYKFRTMRVDAESDGKAVWATQGDPRVTWIGRWLRQYRLDELPQLLNVLKGDMNLVGPRPERPELFHDLRQRIPHYQLRQRTRPGLTGHAQINLSYDTTLEDVEKKVALDLEYIERRSLWEDFKIMLKTIPVMLFRKGGW